MNKNNKLLEHLFSLKQGEYKLGLERIEEILQHIGNPQNSYPTIHVAGTNGKGGVCSYIASILQENGLKVGLYTSPHIIEFNERIRINGTKIADEEIAKNYALIEEKTEKLSATFFEITTAIAFNHFKNEKVDIAIIETGLGGRLDSTNIIEKPILSIITAVDIDHSEILGNSIEKIADEKAAIIKKNSVVLLEYNKSQVIEIIQDKAEELSAEMYLINNYPEIELRGYTSDLKMILDINLSDLPEKNNSLILNLLGSHQLKNISISIFAVSIIFERFSVTNDAIIRGIENVSKNTGLRFRAECVNTNPPIILDVAHNPQSIEMLIDTLKEASTFRKWNFIFGAMKDKNITKMLQKINEICDKLTIVSPNIERAASVDEIAKLAETMNFNEIIKQNSIEAAINDIKQKNEPTIICGSFYVISEAVSALDLEM
jgi:dihydrofolate synthase/folylpolyglutamate synthase